MKHTIVDEIISLGRLRVQKVFGLYDHVLVIEIFSKSHRRLFLVFDHNRKTKTLHVQKEKPIGQKSKSPFIAQLNKFVLSHFLQFHKLDEDGLLIKAVFADDNNDDCSLLFELDAHYRVGLFHQQNFLSSMPPNDALALRAGFLVNHNHQELGLQENFNKAIIYQEALLAFHQNAFFAAKLAHLKQALTKKRLLLKNVEDDLARAQATLLQESDADLLKTHMHELKRGMKSASLMDYALDPPALRTIALDEKLTPQEQASKIYARIKKSKRGIVFISERLEKIRENIATMEQEFISAQNAGATSVSPLVPEVDVEKQSAHKILKKPYRQFISRDGVTLWVGKSAKDSDQMLRLAKGNEWFFHVRDVPGAHVIARNSDGLSEYTIFEAALLAHHYSKLRNSPSATVQYTRVKYVQKKKGLAAGKVLITQEKSIEIDENNAALKELLDRLTPVH